jgi:hypothetical protein
MIGTAGFHGILTGETSMSRPSALTRLNLHSHLRNLALLACVLLLGACAAPGNRLQQLEYFPQDPDGTRIALMPLDVELSLLTASGLLEPQAEWTQNAITHIQSQTAELLATDGVQLTNFELPESHAESVYVQLTKLHEAVGSNVILHELGPVKLPTKKNSPPDWSLGSDVHSVGSASCADYGLFVFVRDSYASAGRAGMMVFAAVVSMGNVALSGGQQTAFASLVDLKTGEIVWFNRIVSTTGDLRTEAAAQNTMRQLLARFPKQGSAS